ncbi:hypothetical protein PR048_031295 [Dryococelus australis]|uniref:Uncharacterized protein n=1 Tax=Dryococelus australis TaxID=614101 RepID=A0ABQ9G7Y6_9NEOP|nr:hypothetical protein PR048_031295 [Dryococelus australis]
MVVPIHGQWGGGSEIGASPALSFRSPAAKLERSARIQRSIANGQWLPRWPPEDRNDRAGGDPSSDLPSPWPGSSRLELLFVIEAKTRGSNKVDTATRIKYANAAKRKALNWFAVLSSCLQRHDGNTARLARRSDEALGVRVTVALLVTSGLARIRSESRLGDVTIKSGGRRVAPDTFISRIGWSFGGPFLHSFGNRGDDFLRALSGQRRRDSPPKLSPRYTGASEPPPSLKCEFMAEIIPIAHLCLDDLSWGVNKNALELPSRDTRINGANSSSSLCIAIGCRLLEKAFSYLTGPIRTRQHRHGSYVIRVQAVNTCQKVIQPVKIVPLPISTKRMFQTTHSNISALSGTVPSCFWNSRRTAWVVLRADPPTLNAFSTLAPGSIAWSCARTPGFVRPRQRPRQTNLLCDGSGEEVWRKGGGGARKCPPDLRHMRRTRWLPYDSAPCRVKLIKGKVTPTARRKYILFLLTSDVGPLGLAWIHATLVGRKLLRYCKHLTWWLKWSGCNVVSDCRDLLVVALRRPLWCSVALGCGVLGSNPVLVLISNPFGAVVVVLLARSPPTKANPVQSPAGVTGFSHVGIVPDDAVGRRVFSRISRFPALSFRRCSILASVILIGSQDLAVKSRPNVSTHSNRVRSLHSREEGKTAGKFLYQSRRTHKNFRAVSGKRKTFLEIVSAALFHTLQLESFLLENIVGWNIFILHSCLESWAAERNVEKLNKLCYEFIFNVILHQDVSDSHIHATWNLRYRYAMKMHCERTVNTSKIAGSEVVEQRVIAYSLPIAGIPNNMYQQQVPTRNRNSVLSGDIWAALNADRDGAAPECKGGGKREIPGKTLPPDFENPGANPLGTEPKPLLRDASNYLPPTKANQGSIPGGVVPGCSYVRVVPDDSAESAGFSQGSPVSPLTLHSGAAPCSPPFTLVDFQEFDVTSRRDLSLLATWLWQLNCQFRLRNNLPAGLECKVRSSDRESWGLMREVEVGQCPRGGEPFSGSGDPVDDGGRRRMMKNSHPTSPRNEIYPHVDEGCRHTLLTHVIRHRKYLFVPKACAGATPKWGRGDVVARLLASHLGEPGSVPGRGRYQDFRAWESYWTMSLVGGFSRGSPVSPPLHPVFAFRHCSVAIAAFGAKAIGYLRRDKGFVESNKIGLVQPNYRPFTVNGGMVWKKNFSKASEKSEVTANELYILDSTNQDPEVESSVHLEHVATSVTGLYGGDWSRTCLLSYCNKNASPLASHQGELSSIPGRATGLSQVGIVPDDAVGWRVFPGISRLPRPFDNPHRLSRPRSTKRDATLHARIQRSNSRLYHPFTVTSDFSEALLKFYCQDIPPPRANEASPCLQTYIKGIAQHSV